MAESYEPGKQMIVNICTSTSYSDTSGVEATRKQPKKALVGEVAAEGSGLTYEKAPWVPRFAALQLHECRRA